MLEEMVKEEIEGTRQICTAFPCWIAKTFISLVLFKKGGGGGFKFPPMRILQHHAEIFLPLCHMLLKPGMALRSLVYWKWPRQGALVKHSLQLRAKDLFHLEWATSAQEGAGHRYFCSGCSLLLLFFWITQEISSLQIKREASFDRCRPTCPTM